MPPKRKGAALYKDAMSYYKAAYRAHLKESKADWTTAQITSTLAWMWTHAPDTEKQTSRDLLANRAQNLPEVDDDTVPADPRTKNDPAPDPVLPPAPARVEKASIEGEDGIDDDNYGEPPAKRARINTTAFSYWPDPATISAEFPDGEWLAAGLLHPDEKREEKQWHGVCILGEGAAAQVGLWIKVNSTNNIVQRLAVKDVTSNPTNWVNPIHWRDQLPREVAIQRRLNKRDGHEHHVHRYYGDRISFWQRKYRLYNEVCDIGSLMDAMDWYSRIWRRRRNFFTWIEMHPELRTALDDRRTGQGTDAAVIRERKRAWNRFTQDPRYKQPKRTEEPMEEPIEEKSPPPDELWLDDEDGFIHVPAAENHMEADPNFDDFKDMSDIEDWHKDDLSDVPTEVIPEAFLWTVFDQLLDAFIILGKGGEDVAEGKEIDRREIVHKDVHLQNIFVKRHEGAKGIAQPVVTKDTSQQLVRFGMEEFPSVVLADFDQSFFDLQSPGDKYPDNPAHYIWNDRPSCLPGVGGRYPPELYWDYEGHQDASAWEKFTARTDVWGVGQVMWNLVMNLPGKNGHLQQPFLDGEGTSGRELVNGLPYTDEELDSLFSGRTPFEASARYSEQLKTTIKECLAYRQDDRPSFQALKHVTTKYAYGKRTPDGSTADGSVVVRFPGKMKQFDIGGRYGEAGKAGKKRRRA